MEWSNLPTAVWIDEHSKIVRPTGGRLHPTIAYKTLHRIDAQPYLTGLLDWLEKG